jgi:hypothetical protein
VVCEPVPEVDLQRRGQVAGPDQRQQHRHRRGLEASVVPAWRIVAAELDAQVDQQPGSNIQEPVTSELPIGPDRPDDLLVDLPLDREPGQRPNPLTLAALPPDPLAGQEQLGAMADRRAVATASWWRRCRSTCRRARAAVTARVAARSARWAASWMCWVIATTRSWASGICVRRE